MRALSGNESVFGHMNFIQDLDVRTKMLFCLFFSSAVIFIKEWYPLLLLLAASLIYLLAHRQYRVVAISYAMMICMFFIALCCIKAMVIFIPEIGTMGLALFINPFLRVMILLNFLLALAVSSRIQEIMTSLKSLRLPLFIYLPATVMIRFIPSLINDIKQISESMKIKGYHVNIFSLTLHPLLTTRLLFVPMVIRALRSSDELSIAAELKGIGYFEYTTCLKRNRLGSTDFLALGYALILLGLALNFGVLV